MKRYLASLAVMLVMLAGAAFAQVETSPGVARISLIHGDVTLQRGDSNDWVAATLNTPVVRGDGISTGNVSRAEVQLDYANVLRLDANAYAKVTELNRSRIQVQVGNGLADYSVFKGAEAEAEIDTPNLALHPLGEGVYRVQVNSNAETQVIVRKGEAEITTPQGSTRVQSGQMITVEGTNNPEYQTVSAPAKDDWDRWNSDRDSLIRDAQSWRYTNRYYTGSDDLDAYGHWVYVPDYGQVWTPVAGPGWAPYSSGRWVWEPYYGWTWVSYEPWGWAPYHYGRWFLYGGSWCWWPGPVYAAYRPLWAPAYVSFFGLGFHSGFGFGFGFGNIGWLPIGPGDYYHPWYGRGVNIVNVTNITNIYNYNGGHGIGPLYRGRNPYYNLREIANNPRLLNAVSTMPAQNFGRMPVRRATGIDAGTFRQAGALTGRVPVVPTRESLRPTDRPVSMGNRVASNQRFFSTGRAAAAPVPFNRQVGQMQNIMRNSAPQVATQVNHLGISRQQPVNAMNTLPGRNQVTGSAGQQFGRNAGVTGQNARQPQANSSRPGWQRFGGSMAENNAPRTQNTVTRGNVVPGQVGGNQPGSRGNQPQGRQGWSTFSNGGNQGTSNANRNQNWRQAGSGPANQGQRDSMPARTPRNEQAPAGNQGGWRRFSDQPQSRQPNMSTPRNYG
ncbi:MAG TPA: DUF6600 domain-containing protein, partial [Terriglobales bacterium]|nr:DUF6600 domain-containing protein [Terriglobales bacterium]